MLFARELMSPRSLRKRFPALIYSISTPVLSVMVENYESRLIDMTCMKKVGR
jgi:hypothetical protein